MQVNITLTDGSKPSFQVDAATATLKVEWQVKSQDGFQTQSYAQAFALAEITSVGFAADPAPDAVADPAPADVPADATPDAPAAASPDHDAPADTDLIAEAQADLADATDKLDQAEQN